MRKPKINSTFIKKYYKSSTIPRLIDHLGYGTTVKINQCPIITEWLDRCYELGNTGYVQEEMFEYIYSNRKG